MNKVQQGLDLIQKALIEKANNDSQNTATLIELLQSFPRGRDCFAEERWRDQCKLTLQRIVGEQAMETAVEILRRR